MRRALDGNPTITTKHGQVGYGYFGKHAGYDYGVVRWAVRAPEAGTISAVYTGRQNVDGGNIVELVGKYTHRFLHLDTTNVKVGDKVTEGQQLAITGNSGNVGFHLHHDVRKNGTGWRDSYNNYVDWEALLKTAPQGGTEMFNTIEEVKEAYLQMRGVVGTDAEMRGWIGQSKQRWIQVSKAETDSTRAQLANANKQIVTLTAQVAQLNTSVNQLKTQVASLTGQVKVLTDSITAKDKEIADLKAQVAAGGNGEDTDLLNKFGEILRKLIARLGLK